MAITSTNVVTAITKLVAVDVLPAILGELVVGNLVARDFEPTFAQPGDTASCFGVNVEMSNFAEVTFNIPDVTKVLAVPDLLQLYMRPAVVALAEKIETDLLGLHSQFTANLPVGSQGSAITEATIDAADTALFQSKVPASQPKYLVTDANTYSQLRQIPRFSEFQTAGEAGLRALVDGCVGKIRDFFVFRSPHVSNGGLAFARNAMALVLRRLQQPMPGTGAIAEYAEFGNFGIRVVCSYQPNTLAQQFTVGILYGCTVLNSEAGVQVLS